MSKMFRKGLIVAALLPALLIVSDAAFAQCGTVKLKTDNGADGYYYNAGGAIAARYVTYYDAGEFDPGAILCGARVRPLNQGNPPLDTLLHDLRTEDPNTPSYADLSVIGLIINADANSLATCSTTGAPTTVTYGGGFGIPDPGIRHFLTASQSANGTTGPLDFCGVLLDTSSAFVNYARSQGYAPGGFKGTIGFNHFLEELVFEPKLYDLNMRMSGSSRFAGDTGLPIMFARRNCDTSASDCSSCDTADTTDDYITAQITVDNNTGSDQTVCLIMEADRSAINPALGPKDVTKFFRPVGGGAPVMNPITVPQGRTALNLEIMICIKGKFTPAFPTNLPFNITVREDANDPNCVDPNAPVLDDESQLLGLRPATGYYDDNVNDNGFYYITQAPVLTGDAAIVEMAAVDLPKPGNTTTISGFQVVAGEFGGSGLAGLPGVELRLDDPVLPGNPDLSPQALLRTTTGALVFGPPPTTVTADITDYTVTPALPGLAKSLHARVLYNPGDSATVTAISQDATADTLVGLSSFMFTGNVPVSPAGFNFMIRVLNDGFAGTVETVQTPAHAGQGTVKPAGYMIPLGPDGQRLDD